MNTIRLSRKQSITEFAEEIGISRSEMQNILKGTCNLRLDTIRYIADKLSIHPSVLLFPSYSGSQLEYALLLLQTIDVFSHLPEDQQTKAAELFHELILLLKSRH